MFNNRTLQMKFVKTPKSETTETPQTPSTPVDYVQFARETGTDVVKGIAVVIATYMAMDTLRQVTVNAAPKNH